MRNPVDQLPEQAALSADLNGVQAYPVWRLAGDTDCANLPMAAAFDRAGYRNYGIQLVLSAIG